MVALAELVSIKGGGTPSKSVPEYWDGNIPWASVKDFKSSILDTTIDSISHSGVENSATNVIPAGSIVVPTRMAVGKVAVLAIDMAINQDLKALFIKDESIVDKRFLLRFLESQEAHLLSHAKGATVKGITLDVLKELDVPLPPIKEQKRIAAILDKADNLRCKRQQAIQLADEFLRAAFLDMFGDPLENPKGWMVGSLGDGISSITAGWSAQGDSSPCGSDGLGVLKISAVTSGAFKPLENKKVDIEAIPRDKQLIFPVKGDLLFSRANTRELVAATCIVTEDSPNTFLPDKLWRITTEKSQLSPVFLNCLLKQPRFRALLTSQATGTSGSMLNISKAKFLETSAIFPDIDLQYKFQSIYWSLQSTLEKIVFSSFSLDILFNSLSQKAFSGDL